LKKLSKKSKKRLELSLLVLFALLSIFLWNTVVIFPIKILVVLLHEISHGVAALVTGGTIKGIDISLNLGGECIVAGGNTLIIASAGYLGSLVWGSLLFTSSYKYDYSKVMATTISIILFLAVIFYIRSPFGVLVSLIFSLIFYLSPRHLPRSFHFYLLRFIGLVSALYVIIDIKQDLITLAYRETDAQRIAELTGIAAVYWGILWLLISVAVLYYLFKYGYSKGIKTK
jgi:hypothetical protein